MSESTGTFDLESLDRDLFDLLLEEDGISTPAEVRVIKRACSPRAPLSSAQARLWFFDQMEPGSAVYNMPGAWRFEGALSVHALGHLVLEIVRRHESLRTSFEDAGGKAQQVINSAQSVYVESWSYLPWLVDVSHLPASERPGVIGRLVSDDATRPFDLLEAPLFRTVLIREASARHVLLATMHHIISDEWSVALFVSEMTNLYARFALGLPSELEELRIQYSDVALWQQESLGHERLRRELEFWQAALEGAPSLIELPADHPRPASMTYRGDSITRVFGERVSEALRCSARDRGLTIFMLLLAVFEILIFRYTAQEDFVIGGPVAGRDSVELQGLIGFFVNMLAFRASVSADKQVTQVLEGVRATALNAYAHQSLPFESLVEALQPDRDPSRSGLFNVTFSLEQGVPSRVAMPGLAASLIDRHTGTAKFDLVLAIVDSGGGFSASFEYRSDLFDSPTIERMMGHLGVLFETIPFAADQRISSLGLLSESELSQLVNEWNDTDTAYAAEQGIHSRFEQQVDSSPDSVAVVFEAEQLTYLALNQRANRLAHYLRRHGVAAETCVALCVERSLEMPAALLGIMKAGGAYLPLDPQYPLDRLAHMISDSGTRWIIAERKHAARLPATEATILFLEDLVRDAAPESDRNTHSGVTTENLIYLIYTSGSSGVPKGTAIPHKGPLNCIAWLQRRFGFSGGDRLLMKASLSFDASVWEVFWPLVAGSTVVMIAPGEEQDSASLLSAISRLQVTSCQFVPSMLRAIIDEPGFPDACSLKLAFSLGEALPIETMVDFVEHSRAELHNFYGPTETSMGCMDWLCEPVPNRNAVPVGRPISNIREYILDGQLCPGPVGAPGELYICGDGVAFGYHGRPGLTAERFLPASNAKDIGSRMYRSGDLCRYLNDGNIEFLGRVDHQVKIRGFRIELGEVEAALAQHESVRECVVVAREDLGKDRRLVAYIVPEDGADVSPSALRAFVNERLPGFMSPAYFVTLSELPLTPNGKVDRRALPRPNAGDGVIDQHQPIQDGVEELLANIWAEVLGTDRVGRNADFFHLGGHSLLATQAASRIREAFRVELPLKKLFERPILSELSELIRIEMGAGRSGAFPAIAPVQRGSFAPLSHAQERLWFLDQLEHDRAVYNTIAGLRLTGPLFISALEEAVSEIIRRHESLRTTFEVRDGEPVQLVHPYALSTTPIVDLKGLAEPDWQIEMLRLAKQEAARVFDLGHGPLFKIGLFKTAASDHSLFAFTHHIVSDGWSMNVLTEEFASLYQAFCRGEASPLDDLPIQYSDFALWHRDFLKSRALDGQLDYWRGKLDGAPPVLDIPFDRPRPTAQTYNGATLFFDLSSALTGDLHAFAKSESVTLFMVLLAVFQTLLHRYSHQDDICLGSPISNRTRKEIEGLIGFFANTLVLRARFDEGQSFRELLKRTREAALEAYAHQDLPFEMIVEALQPVRDLSHSPLFQILFVLQNAPRREVSLPGIDIEGLSLNAGKAHFDLSLSVMEEKGALQCAAEYNTDLFDESTISRLAGHLRLLLSAVKDDPRRRISALPLLTEREASQLLRDFNSTACEFPSGTCVHELVEEHARLRPDAISSTFDGSHISYRTLDWRAEALAARLRAAGVGPDALVGICVSRSIEMVVGLLGILKAGAAYVPLDPEYPANRLTGMMRGVDVVVCERDLSSRLPDHGLKMLDIATGAPDGHAAGHSEPVLKPGPQNLAYVVHTSGSTGEPKGVAMPHRSAVKMLSWQRNTSGELADGRTLQFASLSFDVSFQEIFSTLSSGGTLVLISDECRKDVSLLLAAIQREQAERVFLPVVALQQMAEAVADNGSVPITVREVSIAGEQLKISAQVSALFQRLPGCALFNHYGPSETHAATAYRLSGSPRNWPELPPIGAAIQNTSVYLLDRAMNPVPLGITGAIYIGGSGLARGYQGPPAMTAERFTPDPFSERPGSRLYTSGDIGRYRLGGAIDYLGRSDHQVKIRGYRVEPAEIEIAIRQVGWVKQTVVVARRMGSREKQLIAYVVAAEGEEADITALKASLKRTLPLYMLPSAFVLLDRMPLTASGKIDRLRLPAPAELPDGAAESAEPFHNLVEEIVAETFCSALGVDRVGLDYNFFDEGGNSLSATRVVSKLRSDFNVELPLRKIFESPTVEGLAASIDDELKAGRVVAAPAIPRRDRSRAIPLSFAQQRIWFLTSLAPDSRAYYIAGAIRIIGALDDRKLETAINTIVSRHEILRTSFEESEGYPVQAVHADSRFELERTEMGTSNSADIQALAIELASRFVLNTVDLTEPRLLRALLIGLGETEHLLAVSMHHIVSDGASIAIFFRELAALYEHKGASTSQLPELKIQYADYAAWQRESLQSNRFQAELEYWRRALAGASGEIRLPIDRPRPLAQTFTGSTAAFTISAQFEQDARRLGRIEGATVFMTFLAAFQALLHKYSGQRDILIGAPLDNRHLAETESLIGFFVNTSVIRTRIDPADRFRVLLRQVRERAIEAYAHQEVPFERIVEELQPQRDLSRSPLFQVAFAVSPPSGIAPSLGDLRIEQIELDTDTAKFDLFLSIHDTRDSMSGLIEFNTDLFDRTTVERLAHHLVVLSGNLISQPDRPLREVSILAEASVAQLTYEWNDRELIENSCIFSDLFEDVAARLPDSIAIVQDDVVLTYDGLNNKANQLARYLIEAGLRPGQTLGLCLKRSTSMIVAMTAALKAGVAYLPLDPASPAERLRMIAEDAGISIVMGESEAETKLLIETRFLPAGVLESDIARYSGENLAFGPSSRTTAYVMYTSGSTGCPKGVIVEQCNLASYVRAIVESLDLEPGTSFAALSAPSADLGYTAVFPALATGGCVHIIPEELFLDGGGLAEYFDRHRIDCLKIVPSHLAALQSAAHPRTVSPRNRLILGGEASDLAWVRSLRESIPGVSIVNHYGPTETTVGVSTYSLEDAVPGTQTGTLPIGRPLANARLYLLSEDLAPVPAGAAGDLYIAGGGVARGYSGQTGATADKFIPEPFCGQAGSRMYASGDIGRWLPDGTIEFLGRRDDQLKVRGYRVEPREIESVILSHPDVSQAVVLPSKQSGQQPAPGLVAYVVPNRARARSIAGHVRYRLPNNLAIVHINKNETDYIYREIFELQAYLRFGAAIDKGSVVLDVGANIGLFTLFVAQLQPSARIFAFEPNPRAFEMLKINTGLYAPGARLFSHGLASRERVADFTSFPGFTLFSGLYADSKVERQVVRRFVSNQAAQFGLDASEIVEASEELLSDKFESETFPVALRTLSDVIRENGLDRIDFLKINVEKSEAEVLKGIDDDHWRFINQIVLEVDLKENLSEILETLGRRGYQVNVTQDQALTGTELVYVYAHRAASRLHKKANGSRQHQSLVTLPEQPFLSAGELRVFLAERLPDYMTPGTIQILDSLPMTPNGKVDRAALPRPDAFDDGRKFVPPGNAIERLIASVWEEVLGVPRVSVNDNFFNCGGNSLLLAQVWSKLRRTINPKITIMELFRYPTVQALAGQLSGNSAKVSKDSPERRRGEERRSAVGLRSRRTQGIKQEI